MDAIAHVGSALAAGSNRPSKDSPIQPSSVAHSRKRRASGLGRFCKPWWDTWWIVALWIAWATSCSATIADLDQDQDRGPWKSYVVIDKALPDADRLPAQLGIPDPKVLFLDSHTDGLDQLASVLRERSGIDALHLFSHASSARLFLGSALVSANQLSERQVRALESIGR